MRTPVRCTSPHPTQPATPVVESDRQSCARSCNISVGRPTDMFPSLNGNRVLDFPDWMVRLGRRAIEATGNPRAAKSYTPDTALINFHGDDARMGMHQDKDEASLAPVVSVSEAVRGHRAAFGPPLRLRRSCPTGLSRGHSDPSRHRTGWLRSAPRTYQHHHACDGTDGLTTQRAMVYAIMQG